MKLTAQQRYLQLFAILVGAWLLVDLAARLGAEILWFQEVGYLRMYLLRLLTQGVVWAVVFSVSAGYLLGNLFLAQRLKYPHPTADEERQQEAIAPNFLLDKAQIAEKRKSMPLRLRWLFPLVIGLSMLVGLLLIHYGEVVFSQWHSAPNLPNISPPAPALFSPETVWQLGDRVLSQNWYVALIAGIAIALITYPQFALGAVAIAMSIFLSVVLSRQWGRVLQYFHPTTFNTDDPLFGHDISFYIFALPCWNLWEFWLVGLFLLGLIAIALTYLLSGNSLSQGKFIGFSNAQQRHLYGLMGCFMTVVSLSYWLRRYNLLYSSRGVSYGASYTDITVQLPAYTVLSLLALAIAGYLFWRTIFWSRILPSRRPLFYGLEFYLAIALFVGSVLPIAVQSLIVQPNELVREQTYIERTIAHTRTAFGLENIDTRTFDPKEDLTYANIQANDLTIRNIRLWDQQPLLATNRQLQQIRLYYRFPDADIDRYTFVTEKQQVLIAARELDYSAVPKQAQTWVNQHLIYTHGYGFTLSPVNRVGIDGLPEYFVKDIGITEGTPLTTSSEAVRNTIPIGQPRIYYGEIANTYVMTPTKAKELDYPSGNDNAYNTYDGNGGINISSFWRKCLFAKYLHDWQMLLTRDFLPTTKLLFRRNINQRIRAIAPFLRYDSDPYLVAVDAGSDKASTAANPSYLYWIVDAYTSSDRYPYSDIGTEGINYIRNSVKVVIDAYHGSVNFYIADPSDPIITTWAGIFPDLFKPLSAMPANLRNHLRYPVDFFKMQSERLMTYHMTDPQVFYNREDQWQIPTEVYGDRPRLVDPYYLITSLPTVKSEEFILLLPFTPKQRTNLVAWLAARSDGENYGKLLLYVFPKQRLVYGPEQIEARINQDPVISQQISLWNRQGSRAVQGNLLVIPIDQSLLYVEPLYLEATQNKLPILARVIVAYENRIVMAKTLQQALEAIFKTQETPIPPPIIRSLE